MGTDAIVALGDVAIVTGGVDAVGNTNFEKSGNLGTAPKPEVVLGALGTSPRASAKASVFLNTKQSTQTNPNAITRIINNKSLLDKSWEGTNFNIV